MASHSQTPWYIRLQRFPGKVLRKLSELGAALVWPIEWSIGRLARAANATIERFEGVESLALRIGYALLWPVRMLWAGLRGAADLLPESLLNVITWPFRAVGAVGQWCVYVSMRAAEALNLDGAILRLVSATRFLWYPFAAIGGFVHAWLITRKYKQLLWGLPAVVIFGPILAAAAWSKLWGQASVAADYRVAVTQALEAKDYQRVQLYERKLAQLGVENERSNFQRAMALGKDDVAGAYERMKALAPVDTPGLPAAHLWIIQQLLEKKLGASPQETHRLMGIHLNHLKTLGIRNPEMELLRAYWQANGKQYVEAAETLGPLVNRLPPAAVMRMEIDISLGRADDARSDARAVRAHMNDRTRRGLTVGAQDLRAWATAEQLLGDADESRRLVRQWVKLEPNNLEARQILSEANRLKFQELLALPDPDPQVLAELFIEAAEMTDDPHLLQRQVGMLYRLRDRIPVARRVIELVANSPRTQSAILEAAGTAAAEAGNFGQARTYLVEAVQKDPKNAIAWNNYAFILLQETTPNYEEALKAVNKALQLVPDEYHFRETRGQILVRLRRWQEAIPDLEYAVNAMPTSRGVHLALAEAYEATGDAQLARIHREQAH